MYIRIKITINAIKNSKMDVRPNLMYEKGSLVTALFPYVFIVYLFYHYQN